MATKKIGVSNQPTLSLASPLFRNRFLFGALVAVATLSFHYFYHFRTLLPQAPFEDAAMLMRYANNLASGNGIVWNPGESPQESDGATDLGFVLLLAALRFLGIDTESGAFILNFAGAALLGGFILLSIGAKANSATKIAYGIGAVVLVFSGPSSSYLAAGFSPIIFALFLSVIAYLPSILANRSEPLAIGFLAFGFVIGLAGWWRPEGFVLGPIIAISSALIFRRELFGELSFVRLITWKNFRNLGLVSIGFLIPMVMFLGLRIIVFGQLAPTSVVNKGSLSAEISNLIYSLAIYGVLLAPLFVVLFLKTLRSQITEGLIFLSLLLATSSFWMFVQLENNWWFRMQWPLIPVFAVLAMIILSKSESLKPSIDTQTTSRNTRLTLAYSATWIGVFSLTIAGASFFMLGKYFPATFHTNFVSSVKLLDSTGIRLATTEAGLIPLRLENAIVLDTWGLNNREIAASKGESLNTLLEALRPNLIVVHGKPPQGISQDECSGVISDGEWDKMVSDVLAYAENPRNEFNLIRADLTGVCDAWSVFASPEIPENWLQSIRGYPDLGYRKVTGSGG
jgi:hypothetical protein